MISFFFHPIVFFCCCEIFTNKSELDHCTILFLTTKVLYKESMMRYLYDVADAYRSVANGQSVIWGVGFDDYNSSKNLKENIINRFGSLKYFAALMIFYHRVNELKKMGHEIKAVSNDIIVIFSGHEYRNFAGLVDLFGVKILTLAYGKEVAEIAYDNNVNVDMLVHLPNTAPLSMFGSVTDKKRLGGVVLVGAIYEAYPIRQRWKKLIQAGKIPEASIYRHPGYDVKEAKNQYKKFSDTLLRNKIALFCSGINKYQISKFAECAIAGILMIATLPDDNPGFWAKHIVQVDVKMSDNELIEIVKYWFDHDVERVSKAKNAQLAVLSKYTMNHTAQLLARSIALHQSGFRGTRHDYQFVNTCAGKYPPYVPNKWCKKKENIFWERKENRKVHKKKQR